jgi:hypothetical protein
MKNKLTERIGIRLSPYEKNFIQGLANIYAEGSISALLLHSVFNLSRKAITKEDFPRSKRYIRKCRKNKAN